MAAPKTCPACDGKAKCFRCKGSGKTGTWVTTKCGACSGRGTCSRCNGKGTV